MRVNLQAQGLWTAIEPGEADERDDKSALAVILHAVPPEMLATLAVKDTSKEAWEAIMTIRVDVQRVREANTKKLRQEFTAIAFQDGKTVDDFSMRITGLANNIRVLGEPIFDTEVVKKLLQVVPDRLSQVAISIETLLDLNRLSIEEVTGRLRAVEQRNQRASSAGVLVTEAGQRVDAQGRLLFTEEEWSARQKKRAENGTSGSNGGNARRRGRGRGHDRKQGQQENGSSSSGGNSRDTCRNCGKVGHWAKDCRSKPKAQAHTAHVDDDEPTLLLAHAQVSSSFQPAATPSTPPPVVSLQAPRAPVHFHEEKVFVQLGQKETNNDT